MRHLRSIEEIWDYAIERESKANIFYKNLALLVETPKVRKTIKELAEDEGRHKQLLEDVRVGDLMFTDDEIGSLKLANCLDDLEPHEGMTYMELLTFAIKKEDRAHKLYTRLAQCTSRKDVKELLSQLAQEEAGHRLSLEFAYDLASF